MKSYSVKLMDKKSYSVQLNTTIIQGTFTVTFVVSDALGFVENASIVIDGNTLTTDENGEADITINNGKYDYTVSKTGYDDLTGSVTGRGVDITETVTIEETKYTLDFNVFDTSLNPIANATILIDGNTLTTDATGQASVELVNGIYVYTVNATDRTEVIGNVTIAGPDNVLNIKMMLAQLFGEDYRFIFNGTELQAVYGDKTIEITDLGSSTATHLAGDAKVDLSAFGETYNKANYLGNSGGNPENYDWPYTYFNAANTYEWLVSELNYRRIEAQSLVTFKKLYAKLEFTGTILDGLTELLMYDVSKVDETAVLSYIGTFGYSIKFNGVDQNGFIADNGVLDIAQATTAFSIGGYVNTGDDISSVQGVLGKFALGATDGRYGIYIASSAIYGFVDADSGIINIKDDITFNTNSIYHVALIVDIVNKKVYFYIDGALQNSGGNSYTGAIPHLSNVYDFCIGSGNENSGAGFDYYADAQLWDVRIYHKDVSAQLTNWMNGDALGDEIGWWKCDAIVSDEILDETGTYNLTATNNPQVQYYYENELV